MRGGGCSSTGTALSSANCAISLVRGSICLLPSNGRLGLPQAAQEQVGVQLVVHGSAPGGRRKERYQDWYGGFDHRAVRDRGVEAKVSASVIRWLFHLLLNVQ